MTNSYFEPSELTCPQCGQTFSVDVYIIVDLAERPDLLEKIRNRTLHNLTCPHCSFAGEVDAPLLLFRTDKDPYILFSPAAGTTRGEDQQQARALIEQLKASLATAWRDEWLKEDPAVVQQEVLSAILSDNPEAAMQELAEQRDRELEKLKIEDAEQYFEMILDAWLGAKDMPQKRKILENCPELLSAEATNLLKTLLERAQEKKDGEAAQFFEAHLNLLTACQIEGVDVIFEQLEHQQLEQQTLPDRLQDILDELYGPAQPRDTARRIALCQEALRALPREAQPKLWGSIQMTLAVSLAQTLTGPRAETLEDAIQHVQLALEVFTRQTDSDLWADAQNNLGNMYKNRIRGDRAENLEQAIYHYQLALEVFTPQTDPEHWARTQNNLGSTHSLRIRGNRAENLEQAIYHYQLALEVFTRQTDPDLWATIQSNLGNACNSRIRGDRAENLEQAIYHYQLALEVFTRQAKPEHWATTQNNLASTYSERIRGDRAENLEQAIHHLKQALEVRTRQADPEHWARTQNNLGNAYKNRIRGDRAENLEQAIYHYQLALEVKTREALPEDWARTQNNLASAYEDRIRGNRAENLAQAIYHYQLALEVFTPQTDPDLWATIQSNLGNVYNIHIQSDQAENWEQAIYHYQLALEVKTREAFPEDWARIQHNLGHAYSECIRGDRTENIRQAVRHYQQALEVRTKQTFPHQCRTTARELGDLAFDEQNWELASYAYDEAFAAQDILMQAAFSRIGKQAELQEMQTAPFQAAYAHVRLGKLERAVEILEHGRAQLLRELLERQRHDLEQLPTLGFGRLYEDYMQSTKQYEGLQALEVAGSKRQEDWLARIDTALKKMQAAVAAIREEVGPTYPQYRYFLQALSLAAIQKLAIGKSLVYLMATSAGGLALVVTQQEVRAIELPELSRDSLHKHVWSLTDKETEQLLSHVNQGKITREDVHASQGGYLSMYDLWRWMPYFGNELQGMAFVAWQKSLDETTRWLWDAGIGELVVTLEDHFKSITLIPMGRLALLPLHAAWRDDETQPTGRRYALDQINICYAPSAHTLWQASLAVDRPAEILMAVDNPDGTLVFSRHEVQAVMDYFTQVQHLTHLVRRPASIQTVNQSFHRLVPSWAHLSHKQRGLLNGLDPN